MRTTLNKQSGFLSVFAAVSLAIVVGGLILTVSPSSIQKNEKSNGIILEESTIHSQ